MDHEQGVLGAPRQALVMQFGWKEGRDPSANFDTRSYLAAYPDVAAAHADPLLHFLQYGQAEGRAAFADGHFG